MPLSLFRDRNRSGAYLTMLLVAVGPMGTFCVITLYLQQVLGFSPLGTGIFWLPFTAGIVVGAGITPKLLLRVGPRCIAALGALLSAGAAFWLSTITVQANYWVDLAPAMFLLAVGFGLVVIAVTQAAVYRVDPNQAGIASALLNSAQQLGVALGLAVLAGIAATVTAAPTNQVLPTGEVLVAGYGTAMIAATGLLLAAAALALVTLDARPAIEEDTPDPADALPETTR
ncbi:MFS transporter [Kocuria rosea]|nr:MFS transporter [Kocuria rosea]WIG17602.1 MFS transporter [Kocuria rosea]